MDVQQYYDILDDGLEESFDKLEIPKEDRIFQQDNDLKHTFKKAKLLRPRAYLMCHAFICTYILPYTSRVCLCVPPDRLTAHTGHPRYLDT